MTDTEKILIVDDHPVVLDGLMLILSELMEGAQLFTAPDAKTTCERLDEHGDLDWIFLDVNLPDMDGLEMLDVITARKVTANVIVLSSASTPAIIDRALKHHASGFLSKSFDRRLLRACIDTVERGRVFLSREHRRELRHYRDSVLAEKEAFEAAMSARQRETLLLVTKGYSNGEIARSLGITESTVKYHVHSLMTLLEADNRTHCVAEARRLDLI